MRATMDEPPQLRNIFVGDMSFTSDRALRPGEIEAPGDGRLEALEGCLATPSGAGAARGHRRRQIHAPRDITRRKCSGRPAGIGRQSSGRVRPVALSPWITFRGK
jgi:hypothetical protein